MERIGKKRTCAVFGGGGEKNGNGVGGTWSHNGQRQKKPKMFSKETTTEAAGRDFENEKVGKKNNKEWVEKGVLVSNDSQ